MAIINTGWLVNEDKVFAPKTLISQVVDNNGRTLEYILDNSVSGRIYDCYTERENPIKYIYGGILQQLVEGTEILIRFQYGCYTSSHIVYLDLGMENPFPVYYQGRNYGIILKENVIYTFRFNASGSGYFEIIGDVDTEYNLRSFGITSTATEINYLKGASENIPNKINKLESDVSDLTYEFNEHTKNKYMLPDTIGSGSDQVTTVSTYKSETEKYLYLEAPSNGIAIMTGYLISDEYSAVWMKINDLEVFKVQHELSHPNTYTYHKFAFKVEKGDIITGNAKEKPILYFHPTIKNVNIT